METIALKSDHLESAAELVSRRYQALCELEALLPSRYQDKAVLLPLLANLFEHGGPGVAAIQNGRLVGFIAGWLLPNFRGLHSVYSPEWGNGAELDSSSTIYEEMYRHIAAAWVSDGYLAHYISLFSNDTEAVKGWHWLGFGMIAVDALRGLEPVPGADPQITVRMAKMDDLDDIVALHQGLRRFMRSSPAFFPDAPDESLEELTAWIQDPERDIWLGEIMGKPTAFIRTQPAYRDSATIIIDPGTISITGAFTEGSARGKGLGTAILFQVLHNARANGYLRCSVDFEPMNTLGSRFWLGCGFRPVSLSLLRVVDQRVLASDLS